MDQQKPRESLLRPLWIGDLLLPCNLLLAPLAGISDLVFRSMTRPMGCALAFTEMVSARGLVQRDKGSRRYIATDGEDRPLGVQLFGSEPGILMEAARIITGEINVDVIDFNMGCPVRKVLKAGSGAALLRDPLKVSRILEALRKVVSVPLTIKIRSGWNDLSRNYREIGMIAASAGVDAVTLHPRTAAQGFSGVSRWQDIGELKADLFIPVIGSGDIRNARDAGRMLGETGCDAVMIGRGALGNPWIFSRTAAYLQTGAHSPAPPPEEKLAVLLDHFEKSLTFYGERMGIRNFRKHLAWYTKGMSGGAAFRRQAVLLEDKDILLSEIRCFFSDLEKEPCLEE